MNNTGALKIGYTTGSHATSAFKASLLALFTRNDKISCIDITLPSSDNAELLIDNVELHDNYAITKVTKSDNEDIDVTKGCRIICKAGFNSCETQLKEQKPHIININGININIYAGNGLGIVTKEGLSAPVGFPAINPVPLEMMRSSAKEIFQEFNINNSKDIYIIFEVENGEEIAKNTANFKAGIVGGISFIGKIGLVKPISTQAYLDSLKTEINVASKNQSKTAILTMGNASLKFAKNYYQLDDECFIEIGNYVFDTLAIIKHSDINKISIVTNTGKLTKIAQGKKNTNNRYGDIDFKLVTNWLEKDKFPQNIIEYSKSITTIGALEEFMIRENPDYKQRFYELITIKAMETLKFWLDELNMRNIETEIVLTDGEILKYSMFNT